MNVIAIQEWFRNLPVIPSLIYAIGVDILMGLTVAFGKRQVNSTTSRMGMAKKVATMLCVVLGMILEPHAEGIPLANLIAGAFLVTESISIIENAGRIGVAIPEALKEALPKVRGELAAPIRIQLEAAKPTQNNQSNESEVPGMASAHE